MMKCENISFVLLCLVCLISVSRCSEPNSDKYITSSKAECFSSKNLFSCIKYKTARFVWSVASGQIQLIKNPLNSDHFNLIRIPNDGEDKEFSEYRYEQGIITCIELFTYAKISGPHWPYGRAMAEGIFDIVCVCVCVQKWSIKKGFLQIFFIQHPNGIFWASPALENLLQLLWKFTEPQNFFFHAKPTILVILFSSSRLE